MTKDSKSLDVLGIKPIGEAVKIVTQGTVDFASEFLSRICFPAAEEFGLLLRDKIHNWRMTNATMMVEVAARMVGDREVQAHPRLVAQIIDEASWVDDSYLRDMWAGLLASSCTETGDDDSNLLFVNVLADLTKLQARVLKYSCENTEKYVTPAGLIMANELLVEIEQLVLIAECDDVLRLDRELDHLRGMELIGMGFQQDADIAYLKPSSIALHMYVRCQGSRQSPIEYFNLDAEPTS